jgi:hypothetical protein
MTSQELKSYAKAGAIAEEVFSSIRTVFSYNGAAYESKRYEKMFDKHVFYKYFSCNRYEQHLRAAKISGIRKGALNGILMGTIWFFMFCTYGLVR